MREEIPEGSHTLWCVVGAGAIMRLVGEKWVFYQRPVTYYIQIFLMTILVTSAKWGGKFRSYCLLNCNYNGY